MRATLGAWRATSTAPMYTVQRIPMRAATVALAVPCIPAPVSAMSSVLPMRFASRACPRALLILWAPVWFRSSRFRKSLPPPRCRDRLAHSVRAEGRPTYSFRSRANSAPKAGSPWASSKACSSSSSRG